MNRNLTEVGSVLGLLDREIWIVTAEHGQRRGGLTATWVSSASIDEGRPTMLIGLAPNHFTSELIDGSGSYGLHLLRNDQSQHAYRFAAGSGRDHDKLAGMATRSGTAGAPILIDCLAWLECRVFSRLATGDRTFYWADVIDSHTTSAAAPLREQAFIQSLSDAQRETLQVGRRHDNELLRPMQEAWRGRLPEWLTPRSATQAENRT